MAYISFQPSDFFSTKLYTGTGAELANTGIGFQPDLTWIKARTGSKSHRLFDSPRGVTKWIASDNGGAETTTAESLKSFDSDGFTLGTYDHVNDNTVTFASWNWKGGTTAVPSGGTITPSACSFSTTSGFGIYKYTGNGTSGATIAHGLGKVPTMMFVKRTDGGSLNWMNYNPDVGNDRALFLNLTNAPDVSATYWNSTTPTSTLFSLGNAVGTNNSGDDYVAYVWAPIAGYSKFGGYIGNASSNGPFIYTGFRPAWVMVKKSAVAGSNWYIYDNKRTGFNVVNNVLYANTAGAEVSDVEIDLLSNGFKWRNNNGGFNASGVAYIYMAFAESPLVSSNDIPGLAR